MSNNIKQHRKHGQIKYRRYQLTYPHEGSIIHKSKSKENAIRKCYNEFKRLNGINDGLFSVTDLDNKIEYQFKVRQNKIMKLSSSENMQVGGSLTRGNLNDSPLTPKLVSAKDNIKTNNLMQYSREPRQNVSVLTNNASTTLPITTPLMTAPIELQRGSADPAPTNNFDPTLLSPALPASTTLTDVKDSQVIKDSLYQDIAKKLSDDQHITKDKIEEMQRLIEQKLQAQQKQFDEQLADHKDQIAKLQNQLAEQKEELKDQYRNIDQKMGLIIENTKEKTELPELPKIGDISRGQIDKKIYEICDQLDELNKKDEDDCVII